MKIRKKTIFGESEHVGAFTVFGFIFSKQIQSKTYIYRVVENFMGYPNIYLLFSKCWLIVMIYWKYRVTLFFSRGIYVKINSKSGGFYVKKKEKRIHFIEKYGMLRQRVSNIIWNMLKHLGDDSGGFE